jgi:hypothetical protein
MLCGYAGLTRSLIQGTLDLHRAFITWLHFRLLRAIIYTVGGGSRCRQPYVTQQKVKTRQMPSNEQETQRKILLLYFTGFFFLTIVFLSPHAGYLDGESFISIARSSPWERWGDWPAAWCSLKVIFLSMGVFLVLRALGGLLRLSAGKTPGNVVLTLTGAPIAGFWIGLYYLIKAVF